jgi:heme a synthase
MTSSELHINQYANHRWFQRMALLTVVVVYLLILVGGIVRSTGAGMGCPDWPKCFGSWVPPTEESQLPFNYKEIYGEKLKGEVVFNVTKTWIEYLNRLFGAFTGLLIFATLIASLSFWKKDRPIFYMSLLAFVLVGFQGWLGSKVVSSELHPVMVTVHMLVAILIVFVLLYVLARSYVGNLSDEVITNKRTLNFWFGWVIGVSLLQVIMGTQVREAIDEVIVQIGYNARDRWIESLDYRFYVHRSFSLIVLALHMGLVYLLKKNTAKNSFLYKLSTAMLVVIMVEIATGIVLAYLNVPAFAQPIHLTLAIVALGVQFAAFLLLNAEKVLNNKILVLEK